MVICEKFEEIRKSVRGTDKIRILAFGSSNTERRIPGTHWFDCLELAIKNKYGRIHHMINSGTGGENSGQLIARFKNDAGLFRPHIAFVTVGGNDSVPELGLHAPQFEKNLCELHRKFEKIGCVVIFQTYYAPIPEQVSREHYAAFCDYMEIVRKVAAETDSGLIDHLKYWLPLQRRKPEKHAALMLDAFHVNTLGNLILGRCVARHFGCEWNDPFFAEADEVRQQMTALQKGIRDRPATREKSLRGHSE